MELKTLLIGMFISMAAFSVKAGIGAAYAWSSSGKWRGVVVFGLCASYAVLFAAVYAIVSRVNVVAHYGTFLPLLRGGIAAHWFAALFIFIWGLYLFSSFRLDGPLLGTVWRNEGSSGSRAWFALVIPCPVCLCSVLVSASCLALYFPEEAAVSVACLYVLFTLTAGAACVVSLRAKPRGCCQERALGTAMMMISAYFIVSALVMPSFAQAGKIYRIAAYSAENRKSVYSGGLYAWGVIASLLAAGYCRGAYIIARRGKL